MNVKHLIQTLILGAFFFSTLFTTIGLQGVVNSPDENANLVFADTFAENLTLAVFDQDNIELGGIIHPRSTVALGEKIVPGSFIGLPVVYGLIGALTSKGLILFITPILALLAIIAWRGVVKAWFDNQALADMAAFLMMIHPAFWYYTGRSMMHNVAFLAFLIFGLWFLFVAKHKFYNLILAGLMIGLALAFRTSEVIWIGVLVLWAVYFLYQRSKKIMAPIIFLGSIMVMLVPFGLINHQTYGSFFETGYTVDVSSFSPQTWGEEQHCCEFPGGSLPIIEPINQPLPGVLGYVFPFGIHELAIVRNVYKYGFQLYPLLSILAVIGLALVLYRRKDKKEKPWKLLTITTIALAAWLGIVYGSWTFTDTPDPSAVSLGNSHVRYWLPLFILSTPLVARALQQLSSKTWRVGVLIVIAAISFNTVFFGLDGFVPTRSNLIEFIGKRAAIIKNTPKDAIIIVDMADKYLWPERRVVVPLRSEITYHAMPDLVARAPLYYYGLTLPTEDLDYLNNEKLVDFELMIIPILTVSNETLYNIKVDEN